MKNKVLVEIELSKDTIRSAKDKQLVSLMALIKREYIRKNLIVQLIEKKN